MSLYRGVNDGFKVNTQNHLLPVLATSIKVNMKLKSLCIFISFNDYAVTITVSPSITIFLSKNRKRRKGRMLELKDMKSMPEDSKLAYTSVIP